MRRTAVLLALIAGALAAVLMTSQASAWDCAPGTHDTGTACVPDTPTTHGKPAGNPGQGHTPVTICHHAGPSKTFTLVVDDDAVPGHLGHGDTLGACPEAPPVTTPVPPPDTTPTPPAPGHTPVTICHHAGPNPANWHTITVDDSALPAHLAHGDTRGDCAPATPPVVTPPVTTPVQPPQEVVAPVTTVTPPKAPAPVETPGTQQLVAGPTPDAFPVRRHGHRGRHGSSLPQRRAPVTRPVLVSAQTASGSLPFTGMDTGIVALLGAGMLGGGALLRRRTRVAHADEDVVARRRDS